MSIFPQCKIFIRFWNDESFRSTDILIVRKCGKNVTLVYGLSEYDLGLQLSEIKDCILMIYGKDKQLNNAVRFSIVFLQFT
jgi:hypothetical protein